MVNGNGQHMWAVKKRRWFGSFTFIRNGDDCNRDVMFQIIIWSSRESAEKWIKEEIFYKKAYKKKIVGDVNFDEVFTVAGALSPVPGGVGPLTVTFLMKNIIQAAKNSLSS